MNRGKIFFGEKKNRQHFILRLGRTKILYGVVRWGDALKGWKGKIGEIFEADKVKCKFDLTQRGSSQNLAFAIDLETLEMIWLDFPYTHSQCYAVAQASNLSLVMVLKRALQKRMSIYELVMLHRNHLDFTKSKTKAKYLISDSEKATLTPYDIEKISSEWL